MFMYSELPQVNFDKTSPILQLIFRSHSSFKQLDVLCVIGRQLSLQHEQEQNPKLSMDAKRLMKTRLKINGTNMIGKSSAQKNIHPEVADIVKITLTMMSVLLNCHNTVSDISYLIFDSYLMHR